MRRLPLITAALLLLLLGGISATADQQSDKLNGLFAELAKAQNSPQAHRAVAEIWRIWTRSGDDDIDQLMNQSAAHMGMGNPEAALPLLNRVIAQRPEFAEGWNRRATAHFMSGDYAASMYDISRTLALEPRHFGALSGMGMIFLETGDRRAALDAFESVLTIYPQAPAALAHSRTLRDELDTEL
jgi:tetratricopeptide (TPR) repeat protein